MYFNDLVEKVNEKMEFAESRYTGKILNNAFKIIEAEVAAGNEVRIHNFGTFKSLESAERKGHNPNTGEEIAIPARKVPKFKPSKSFKELLN